MDLGRTQGCLLGLRIQAPAGLKVSGVLRKGPNKVTKGKDHIFGIQNSRDISASNPSQSNGKKHRQGLAGRRLGVSWFVRHGRTNPVLPRVSEADASKLNGPQLSGPAKSFPGNHRFDTQICILHADSPRILAVPVRWTPPFMAEIILLPSEALSR